MLRVEGTVAIMLPALMYAMSVAAAVWEALKDDPLLAIRVSVRFVLVRSRNPLMTESTSSR
jgi:hypothetical protein